MIGLEELVSYWKIKWALSEAFLSSEGTHARTFPSFMPILPLDRVYFRGASLGKCEVLNTRELRTLSDHLPVMVELEV